MHSPIRVAIAGVGNCASSLVQGIRYYRDADPDDVVPGLMHVVLGGYHVRDLVPVVAFDVDQTKVGTDLGKAIYAGRNNTIRFAEVGEMGVTVLRGPTFDGLGRYYTDMVEESPAEPVDVAEALRTPTPRCWSLTSRSARRTLSATTPRLARRRGGVCERHPGLHLLTRSGHAASVTPGCRSWAMTSRARWALRSSIAFSPGSSRTGGWLSTTRTSSTSAATWTLATCWTASGSSPEDLEDAGGHEPVRGRRRGRRPRRPVRPRAVVEGPQVGLHPHGGPQLRRRAPEPRTKLEVWDSPNSAGVIIDAVRCAKLALDRGIGGPSRPSAHFMKSPPVQYHDDIVDRHGRGFRRRRGAGEPADREHEPGGPASHVRQTRMRSSGARTPTTAMARPTPRSKRNRWGDRRSSSRRRPVRIRPRRDSSSMAWWSSAKRSANSAARRSRSLSSVVRQSVHLGVEGLTRTRRLAIAGLRHATDGPVVDERNRQRADSRSCTES